jgi:hypothetical protein
MAAYGDRVETIGFELRDVCDADSCNVEVSINWQATYVLDVLTVSLDVVDVENEALLEHLSLTVSTFEEGILGTSSFKSSLTTEAGIFRIYKMW